MSSNWNINPETLLFIPGKVWVYWKDKQGFLLGCNDYMAEKLNLSSRQDIFGKSDDDLFLIKAQVEHYAACDQAVMLSKSTKQFEDNVTLSADNLHFRAIKSPLISKDEVFGIIGISYQVSTPSPQKIDRDYYTKFRSIFTPQGIIVITNREADCLIYYLRGYSAREIADTLTISVKTAETHLANIRLKLRCKHRSQIFAMVTQNNPRWVKVISGDG